MCAVLEERLLREMNVREGAPVQDRNEGRPCEETGEANQLVRLSMKELQKVDV